MASEPIFNLKFFKSLVWIDSNPNIHPQVNAFINLIGTTLQIFQTIKCASTWVSQNSPDNLVIVTSSRMIKQVYEEFRETANVYPKYFIFCGNYARAYEMKNHHPYKEVVQFAHWEPFDIVQNIINLEQKIIRDPGAMHIKITITLTQQPTKSQYKKQSSLISKPKQKKQKKTHQKVLIFWVMQKDLQSCPNNQLQDLKNKYLNQLQNQGFPVDYYQSAYNIRQKLNQTQEKQIVLIAPTHIQIPEYIQQSINMPRLLIRVDLQNKIENPKKKQQQSEQQSQLSSQFYKFNDSQDYVYAENLQNLIQILSDNNLQELRY